MSSIYTSKGSLIVEQQIWSGTRRFVKQVGGACEAFYRVNGSDKFRKTGWGKTAQRDFAAALAAVKAELAA